MPEFIHNFTQGKMEKDLDERMVPNGRYRDALNVTVSTSEASNVGALQNLKGNTERRGNRGRSMEWQDSNYITGYSNPVCIGSIRNEPTEKLYWFIASDEASAIAEYNTVDGSVSPILVDTKGILGFTASQHITGINIVDDLLFWTDNKKEPKKINIKKFKEGTNSTTFNIHTKIPTYNYSDNTWSYNSSGPDFTEADITVIKKSPLTQPKVDISTSLRSDTGQFVPGTGVSPLSCVFNFVGNFPNNGDTYQNFTYISRPATTYLADQFRPLPTYGEWLEDSLSDSPEFPANMETVTIQLNQAPTGWQQGDIIVLTGSDVNDNNNTEEYSIRIELTQNPNGQLATGRILGIPSLISRINDSEGNPILISWEALLEEKDPMFEFEFPRFAYRWKYENGEYSCFSPFTEAVFEGDDFEYLSSDGYNLGMQNHIREIIIKDWSWGSQEVIELDILLKKSRSNNIYIVDTIKDKSVTSFKIKTELIGKVVESNQLLRPFDNVPRKALAQEISANRLIYANYVQNFNVVKPKLTLTCNSTVHPGNDPAIEQADNPNIVRPFPSIKTIRNYQLGIAFQDAYGRQTPVFTGPDTSTLKLDKSRAQEINKFVAKMDPIQNIPSWITHAKYFIKDISNEYYNLALDRFYYAEDGNVWLSFPSSERNKVDLETYLILKKQHNNNNPSSGPCRYKILDIQSKAPDFIANSKKCFAVEYDCKVVSGFQEDISELNFKGPDPDQNSSFRNGFNGDVSISIQVGGNKTDLIGVESGGPVDQSDGYKVQLDTKLGSSAAFMGSTGLAADTPVTIKLFKETPNKLPEFEGRFFVKINRDTDFETNIAKPFLELTREYSTVGQVFKGQRSGLRVQAGSRISCNNHEKGFYWTDRGEGSGTNCGTTGCRSRYRLKTPYDGVGDKADHREWDQSPPNSDPNVTERNVFSAPFTGGRFVSMVFAGSDNFLESTFTSNINYRYVGSPMTSIVEGKSIRIVGESGTANDGKVSKEYKVKAHYRFTSYRGKKGGLNVNCDVSSQSGAGGNKRCVLVLELEEELEESWIGNGTISDLENLAGIELREESISDNNSILSSTNPAIFETEPKEAVDIDIYYEASDAFPISELNSGTPKVLDKYFNCYSFGNAVESDRIRDDFNAPRIGKGVKVSSVFEGPYAEERRGSGLIFSGIYNSLTGINRTNQFIQAEPITKDLNPEYGSIQKLHSRNTNLVTLCEDKCLSILANKDALFNADGNVNVTSNKAVLGQAVPYAGEFGISTNPESFADYGFRSYFADKNRGTVIRLSQDGITEIALKGMGDFFSDNLPVCKKIIGSYNDDKESYNLTLDALTQEWQDKLSKTPRDKTNCEVNNDESDDIETTTVSFKETVDGWTSRKSYYSKVDNRVYPLESGVSLNDKYYTFNRGLIWEHASNNLYSNFYGTQYDCSVNVIINDVNESIKGFKTLNYSGTASRSYKYGTSTGLSNLSIAQVVDQQISPSIINSETSTPGWYTNWINTDMEEGQIKEFVKKENKYFNKIKGLKTFYNNNCDNNVDSSAFPTQGIGNATISGGTPTSFSVTVRVDPDCSTSGTSVPDTSSNLWYLWGCKEEFRDIRLDTTPQDVKCIIESFYSNFNSANYPQINITGLPFTYDSASGINVNSYVYEDIDPFAQLTPQQNGAYLYIGDTGTPDHASLDPNNAATVPDSYFVVIIEDGKIITKVQYNTLAACTASSTPEIGFRVLTGLKCRTGSPTIDITTAYSSLAQSARPQAAKCGIRDFIFVPAGGIGTVDTFTVSKVYKYFSSAGIAVGTQLYNEDDTALSASDDGIFMWNSNHTNILGPDANQWGFNITALATNEHWVNHPDNYKFVVFENGIITSIINTNTLNNCT
jgi:hypothetical protein